MSWQLSSRNPKYSPGKDRAHYHTFSYRIFEFQSTSCVAMGKMLTFTILLPSHL